MAHSVPSNYTILIEGYRVRTNLQNHVSVNCNGVLEILSQVVKECKACMAQDRTAQASRKRKPL